MCRACAPAGSVKVLRTKTRPPFGKDVAGAGKPHEPSSLPNGPRSSGHDASSKPGCSQPAAGSGPDGPLTMALQVEPSPNAVAGVAAATGPAAISALASAVARASRALAARFACRVMYRLQRGGETLVWRSAGRRLSVADAFTSRPGAHGRRRHDRDRDPPPARLRRPV